MQKKNLNEMFANIQKQHVRQFGSSNQMSTLTEESIEERKVVAPVDEEVKMDLTAEKKGYGYRRVQPDEEEVKDAASA